MKHLRYPPPCNSIPLNYLPHSLSPINSLSSPFTHLFFPIIPLSCPFTHLFYSINTLSSPVTLPSILQPASIGGGKCPEWPQTEVIDLLALDLKVAGFVAIVSVIYLLGALVVGFLVKNNLKDYKSDYI